MGMLDGLQASSKAIHPFLRDEMTLLTEQSTEGRGS